jgi:ribosome biogenesis GTPase
MSDHTVPGWVTHYSSGFYTVETEQGIVTSQLRGRLKRHNLSEDIVAIGDRVQVSLQSDGTGAIEAVEPRRSALVRTAPTARGDFKQILLANPDQIALVFACADPQPHLRMLDRFLVICEKQNLAPLIIANKVDLVGLDQAKTTFEMYEAIGYPVLYTSAKSALGIEALRDDLSGRLTGLVGPSGVGKTSLLNAIQPNLGLAVREISESTLKGRHTTNVRRMFPLDGGGYVADLPGLRSVALWDVEPEELDGYFPELRPLVPECHFSDCTHLNEPGCAVIEAVEAGTVHPERYESYLRLRFGDELESE